ncbi:MAG: hypothetical protein M1818_002380 [Claussenomyces sp. TS43310]|nr:MAG: hypothetical protein M1818_002380 [Claussenomyces sp. TS43310]
MRVAGEPIFEHDISPSFDMLSKVGGDPKAAEKMEYEVLHRVATDFERRLG